MAGLLKGEWTAASNVCSSRRVSSSQRSSPSRWEPTAAMLTLLTLLLLFPHSKWNPPRSDCGEWHRVNNVLKHLQCGFLHHRMQDVEEVSERRSSVWLVEDFTSVAFMASCASGLGTDTDKHSFWLQHFICTCIRSNVERHLIVRTSLFVPVILTKCVNEILLFLLILPNGTQNSLTWYFWGRLCETSLKKIKYVLFF